MRFSWKLGRIAGIDVFVHPTFLLLPLLSEVWGGGIAMIPMLLATFGCVLLHEFGHALMARRYGIETEDITLYPIGGVARLQRLPRAPGAELLIALAGPAVNFAIVGVLLFLGLLGLPAILYSAGLDPMNEFLQQMLLVNMVLGLFNLLPAFPMDGGRVLRALLSSVLNRARATSIAATIGRVMAVLFAIAAVMWTHNPMHIALAAFIFFASWAEETQVVNEERRRRVSTPQSEGIWVAPPGYRWIDQGNGVWQLAPIVVPYRQPYPGTSSWT